MTKFDDIDHKILNAMQQDASLSIDSLADMVHLSRNACWRRVKQLEDAGVIRGRVALVDAEKVGCDLLVFIFIRTANHDPDWLDKFRKAVAGLQEIIGVHRTSGELDYVLRARVADVKAYDSLYQRLIARVPLSDVSASFVMEDIKDTTALPIVNMS